MVGPEQIIGATVFLVMAVTQFILNEAPPATMRDEVAWLWDKTKTWTVVWPIVVTFWGFAALLCGSHLYPSARTIFATGDIFLLLKFVFWVLHERQPGKRLVSMAFGSVVILLFVGGIQMRVTFYLETNYHPLSLAQRRDIQIVEQHETTAEVGKQQLVSGITVQRSPSQNAEEQASKPIKKSKNRPK